MTLRVRVTLWVSGLLIAVIVGLGAFVYGSLRRGLEASIDDSLRISASQVDASLDIENETIDFNDAPQENDARTSLHERGLTVRILNPAGRVLEAFGPYRALPVESVDTAAVPAGKPVFLTVRDPKTSDNVRMYTTPIRKNNRIIGFIQVAQSRKGMEDSLHRLLSALLLGGPLLVLLAALGGFLLAGRTLAPIDHITRTVRRISAEDLGARLNLPATDDEVGRLAATFDEMLERLEGAFRRERRFTADASHELRTPLAAMQIILSVVRERPRSAADYEQALCDISDEVGRLRALSEDLLRLARGDTRRIVEREKVNFSELLSDVSDSLRPLAEAKGVALACSVTEGLVLQGDRDTLIRLFVNLLDNAVKFTERGSIEISAQADREWILATVSDTGIGIPAEHLPHVLERFYRVDKSRSGRGTGLGLSIAQEIALSHGGTLKLTSAPGRGTTAVVQLPL